MSISIADKVRQAFPFEVQKLPLRGPDNMQTPFFGLFCDDNGEIAGNIAVSRHYQPHTTEDVISLAEAAATVFDGEVADVDCQFNNGHHIIISPGPGHRRSIYGTRDNVFPRMVIRAAYNGKAFQGSIGRYRDACSNLHMPRMVAGIRRSIMHRGNLRSDMNAIIDDFKIVAARWDNLVDAAKQMEEREIRFAEFLDKLYPEPDPTNRNATTRHQRKIEKIFHRLMNERIQTGRPSIGREYVVTGWEAYNAVQGYVQHDRTRRGNPSPVQRSLLALNDATVARAERLVFDMAI